MGTVHNGPTPGMKQIAKTMPDVALRPTACPMCSTPGARSSLYSIERFDGMGQRAAHLIVTMALANHLGLNFGGLLPHPSTEVHGADMHACLSAVVGTDYGSLRKQVRHANFDTCFFGSRVLLSTFNEGNGTIGPNVLFQECGFGKDIVQFLTPQFLHKLRKHTELLRHPTPFFGQDERIRIAVHVRRGDIDVSRQTNRDVPNNIYLRVVETIRSMVPPHKADIHVFSTTKEGKHGLSDFKAFTAAGMNVHLNGDELEDLAHMAQADVLVQAPSSFSWVAGILNSNCVVSFKSYPGGLEDWIFHHAGSFKKDDEDRLQDCIRERMKLSRS